MTWALLITLSLGDHVVLRMILPDVGNSGKECIQYASNIPLQWGPILEQEGIQPHIDMNCVEQPGRDS